MFITDIDNVNYKLQVEDLSLFLPYLKFNPNVEVIYKSQRTPKLVEAL